MFRRTTDLQLADVHAELEGGGAGQRVDLAAQELLLDVGRLDAGELRGVLAGDQRDRPVVPVQEPVVAVVLDRRAR